MWLNFMKPREHSSKAVSYQLSAISFTEIYGVWVLTVSTCGGVESGG
jgi:hypothetical protein